MEEIEVLVYDDGSVEVRGDVPVPDPELIRNIETRDLSEGWARCPPS